MLPKLRPDSNSILHVSCPTFRVEPHLNLTTFVAETKEVNQTSLRSLPPGFRLAASTPWDAFKYSRFQSSHKGKKDLS